jgi:hypothetical protein
MEAEKEVEPEEEEAGPEVHKTTDASVKGAQLKKPHTIILCFIL